MNSPHHAIHHSLWCIDHLYKVSSLFLTINFHYHSFKILLTYFSTGVNDRLKRPVNTNGSNLSQTVELDAEIAYHVEK